MRVSLLWTETDDVLSERLVKKGDKDKQARKAFVVELRLAPIEAKHTQEKKDTIDLRRTSRSDKAGVALLAGLRRWTRIVKGLD